MNLNEIGDLFQRIAIHYPRFASQIADSHGNMRKEAAEEWQRLIGFLGFEEALERLDLYMENNETQKPPMALDFKRIKPIKQSEEWHALIEHQWHIEFMRNDPHRMHGRVFDQEDREYVHDPTYEDGYHYDTMGRICTADGRVVFT